MLPPALRAHVFRKGEVHNPGGKGGEYRRCLRLCRNASHKAAEEIIRLSNESDDERIRYMAATWICERAWGKPKEYDPKAEEAEASPSFNPRDYSLEELDTIEAALRLMVRPRAVAPAPVSRDEIEDAEVIEAEKGALSQADRRRD